MYKKMFCIKQIIAFLLIFTVKWIDGQYAGECKMPNGQSGLCVPVKSCKTIYELLKGYQRSGTEISENVRQKLLEYKCGEMKHTTLVCCSQSEIQLNVDALNILKNNTCGLYSTDKVANGQVAALYGYPWMALLIFDDELTPYKCGGSLISDRYVLTAAHCLKGPKLVLARLGEHTISTERDCTKLGRKEICAPPVEDVGIEEVIIHESYQKNFYYDIALLRLNRTVEFKRHIKPICLPIFDHLRTKIYDNYLIAGWGATETGSSSDVLKVAIVPNVERSECQIELKKHYLRLPIIESQICAGGSNAIDVCHGDSGGPLGYKDFYNDQPRFIQFGLVSFGIDYCGYEGPPTTFSNVSYYMQWITDHMW